MNQSISFERRKHLRRNSDSALDQLYKTYSTYYCQQCKQLVDDKLVLLDRRLKILFVSEPARSVFERYPKLFCLTPVFQLTEPDVARKFSQFVNADVISQTPLSLLLNAHDPEKILLNFHYLPTGPTTLSHDARFMLKLQEFKQSQTAKWQGFIEHYALTGAEARLCSELLAGLSLKEYSEHWHLSEGTARNQLHNILAKTGCRRQVDLFRLMDFYLWA